MAKLYFSDEESIVSALSKNLNDVSKLLGNCREQAAMMVPHDFPVMSFLKSFPSRIDSFHSDLNGIYQAAARTDASLKGLKEVAYNSNKNLDVSVIDSRERLIR